MGRLVDALKIKGKDPEEIIRDDIIRFMTLRGWWTKIMVGNKFQSGVPDLYTCNKRYGSRWIEAKNPKKYSFTPAQMIDFPAMSAQGVGIWILVSGSEVEYNKLFGPPNWQSYLMKGFKG